MTRQSFSLVMAATALRLFACRGTLVAAYSIAPPSHSSMRMSIASHSSDGVARRPPAHITPPSRRTFLSRATAATLCTIGGATTTALSSPRRVDAIGPVKVELENPVYSAAPCPPDRPIPGEKAMKGMRGLCVTVKADLKTSSPKDLEKVGVYGFVTDSASGESVLANNPDLSTDAGQFAMVESVTPKDKRVEFEFVAAVPMEKDISKYENGIGELDFASLRIISFPGGQQYGAISPCEMNEFSAECEEWEEENGPYEKAEYMVKSNKRTKGY